MSLYKRGNVWWVKKWDGKRQVRLSTGCTDYNEALQRASSLVVPLVMDREGDMLSGLVEEGEAFVVGWKGRIDLEIDGAVAWLEFVPAGDNAPGLALKRDHVEAVGFGYRLCGCDGCDGCEFSHR